MAKKKFKSDYGILELFQFYNKSYNNTVETMIFSKVLNSLNLELIDSIYKGAFISFPYSLGDLYISKFKQKLKFDSAGNIITKNKFKMIDYKATNELWKAKPEFKKLGKKIVYENFHSDGYKLKINWKRYHTVRTNKLYNFTPSRAFRRNLATYIKDNPNQIYYDK
ncbi:MAG: hypothetical protein GY775_19290 [Candidatus Scalindua sp.]|nr:hypothetical protein [Candidatus Scalindua sp.]